MGKIVVTAFVTLDGVIQAPGSRDEDRDGGFELGGWTQPYTDPAVVERATRSVLAADALLLGRRSYDLLSSYWPTADPADPRTGKLNGQPKYVVSRTMSSAEWCHTTVLSGDPARHAADLAKRYDEVSIWGSSQLVTTLLGHGLIDEFVLMVHPVVLGSGKRLFNGDHPIDLELVEVRTSRSGVAIHTYRRSDRRY